jgi:hypothetical protein
VIPVTFDEMLTSALQQMDRSEDILAQEKWGSRFYGFANEAVLDIANTMKLKRTDPAEVINGRLDITTLPRSCTKVVQLQRGTKILPFWSAGSSAIINVCAVDGPVEVTYRFIPDTLTNGTDSPELPVHTHGMIVTYMVGRERTSQDVSVQRGANVYFELYEAQKRNLKRSLGEPDTYKIKNKFCV